MIPLFDPARFDDLVRDADSLANLQLLTSPENLHKSAKLPAVWIEESIKDEQERRYYLAKHDIGEPLASLEDYPEYLSRRRAKMAQRLRGRLGLPPAGAPSGAAGPG